MTSLDRCLAAIGKLDDATGRDLRLIVRRAYVDRVAGAYVAEDRAGYQPLLSAACAGPDAAVNALSDLVFAEATRAETVNRKRLRRT